MAGESIGESFMRPLMEGIRAGQSQERINLNNQRYQSQNSMQAARLQNMNMINQMRMMMLKQQLGGMRQNNALRFAQLKTQMDALNEKKREFDIDQQNKSGGNGQAGFGSTMMQTQNDVFGIVKQFNAYDPKTGKVDMSKIPALYQERINNDMQYIQKQGSPPLALKRILQFSNVKSTIDGVDITPLEHYSGIKGKAKFEKDQIAASLGRPSKMYNDYQTLVGTTIPVAAEQIGQAFGGSVQEYASQVRNNAINNKGWANNPELVKEQWDEISNIANKEYANAKAQASNPQFNLTGESATGTNAFENTQGQSMPTEGIPVQKAKKIVKLVKKNGALAS